MSRYFVILGTMRTGSNLLETTLAQFPELVCHGEAFNPAFPGKPKAKDCLGWTLAQRDADPLGFLAHLTRATPGQIPGFRLFDGHSKPVLEHVLSDPDCARIVLRRNPLDSFISLQIARTTDQWILRNPARRVEARVRFEPAAFETYRAQILAYYARLRATMQTSGTTAFELDYEDLKSRETIDGLARFIGATFLPPRLEERIARQNPGGLADKLENPEELAAWLGAAPAAVPSREGPPPLVSPGQAVLSRHHSLIFLPLPGTGTLAALGAMERMDHSGGDTLPDPPDSLLKRMDGGEPFDTSLGRAELMAARAGRLVFAMLRHPAGRAYGMFTAQAFPGAETVAWVRQSLTARFGPLPSLRQVALGREQAAGHDLARQREMFHAFLDLIEDGRSGAGPALSAWAPQIEHLAAWTALVPPDRLCRLETFGPDMRALSHALRLSPLPPNALGTIAAAAEPPVFPGAEVIDAALEDRIAALYADDFAAFGYGPFRPQIV